MLAQVKKLAGGDVAGRLGAWWSGRDYVPPVEGEGAPTEEKPATKADAPKAEPPKADAAKEPAKAEAPVSIAPIPETPAPAAAPGSEAITGFGIV